MRLSIVAVGRLKSGPDRELFDRYWDRVEKQTRALGLSSNKIIEINEARSGNSDQRRAEEAKTILAKTPTGAQLIVLDETGKQQTSIEFAQSIRKMQEDGSPDVCFIIGGANGHGDAVKEAAHMVLSLGRLTLPHGLARIVLAEQVYRATTIIAGHPYHRE